MASKQGMDEAKLAKLTSSLIMPRVLQRSSFMNAAIETMRSIDMLHKFVLTHQKDYIDRHRSTEQDRDNIEHEVGLFVKACRERIESLKNSIGSDEKASQPRWLGGLVGISQKADLTAHQHGVVLILSERLHTVTALFDRFRAVRFQEAIEKSVPRWRKGLRQTVASKPSIDSWQDKEVDHQESTFVAESRQEFLEEETHALQVELTNLLDTVQETERKMIEMSALNHLFSTHVLQQTQQIEMLYQQALEATNNVNKGNKEMKKAIERSSSNRTFLILFLVVLPLAVLFLHWYQ